MIKHLSNTIILLYILSNQLLVAQVEELRESGAFDLACQSGMGPWFFPQYDSDDPIDLSTDDLTIIDKDGVVCFCEGRSEFSGLVTTSEVTLYGNGDVKDVIVSPKENYYFNLIAVTNEDLITFSTVYELKTLTNIDDKLVISIENITFTI